MIDQKFIEELKSRNEIVDVISAYCSLERRGGAYWARCPLPGHMEKTPSFCVNQAGQFYKCFGCQRGGDVVKFIMEVESLTYIEAIRFLCNRANMEMPGYDPEDELRIERNAQNKATRLAILKDAAKFYVNNLYSEAGAPYIDYVLNRGFTKETLRAFGIGCSLNYYDLPKFLAKKGYKYEDMLAAGVVSYNKDNDEYTDFEAKRLVTPIIDSFNNVLAFGGRVIEKTDFAKYKNTRETSVFVKNRTLFNINNIKKLKREKGTLSSIIMVEGYMDVIALHAQGIKNVVASMGTSLTVEQARLLLRYTDTVIVSYDGDAAGQKATFRGMQILKDAGLTVKVIALPDNLDPDEYVKKYGAESYLNLVDNALPLIDYKLHYLTQTFDIKDPTSRRKFLDNALRVVGESQREFEREELLRRLSQITNISYESLKRDLDKTNEKSVNKPIIAQISVEAEQDGEEFAALKQAERFVLSSILLNKEYAHVDDILGLDFVSNLRKDIAECLTKAKESGTIVGPSVLSQKLGEDYFDELNSVLSECDRIVCTNGYDRYYHDCLKQMEINQLSTEIRYLEEYCKTQEDIKEQLMTISKIQKKINRLHELKTEDKK